MTSIRTGAAVALSAALVVSWLRAPRAQPRRFTREFEAGVDAFRLGEYGSARRHLERARALAPKLPGPHRFLAAVALAEQRHPDCLEHAATALRLAPASSEAKDTRALHEACRLGAGRPPFLGKYGEGGAIAITATFAGEPCAAVVAIDDKTSGSTPMVPRAIPSGRHQLVVTLPGASDARLAVDVLPGVVTDVGVALSAAPPAPAAPSRQPAQNSRRP
jgi:PEGA domain